MALPTIHPIGDDDLAEVGAFLHTNLSERIPAAVWADGFRQPWCPDKPNNGFLVRDDDGRLVGVIGAIYAERNLHGQAQRICNITSWCVLHEYRAQSMRLALAVVSQPGYHFTDLTPTEIVAGSLRFLKFQPMDEQATLLPNLPSIGLGAKRARVITDPDRIAALLPADAAKVYADHRHFPWLNHAALGRDRDWCHVIFKKMTLKGLPVTKVIAISSGESFLRHYRTFGSHLLLHRGTVATWVESRFLPRIPGGSRQLKGYRNKMYRSETLQGSDFDNLYSELMALDL